MDKFLKALTIFQLFTSMAASVASNRAPLKADAITFANQEIDGLISKGHLPTDFKTDIGTLVHDVATMHPAISNA